MMLGIVKGEQKPQSLRAIQGAAVNNEMCSIDDRRH